MKLEFDKKNYLIYLLLCWVILFPLIFFPLSGDLSLFLSAAKMLDAGALPYSDIIDIKPPFLFYAVQWLTHIFGSGEQSLRLFDFIMQSIICSFMYFLLIKSTKNKLLAFSSGVLYALSYVIGNYNNTTQIESFMGLSVLPLIYLQVYKREKSLLFFILAFVIGLFTGMKYTLGLLLAAPLLDDYFHGSSWKAIGRKFISMSLGFIVAFGLTLLPYLNSEVYAAWRDMMPYFSYYSSHFKLNGAFVSFLLNNLNTLYSGFITFAILGFVLLGFVRFISDKDTESEQSKMLRVAFISFILLFITVLVERKGYLYHHTRVNSAFMMFAGVGFSAFWAFAKTHYTTKFSKFAIIVLAGLMLMFSPMIRWFNIATLPYQYMFNKDAYASKYEVPGELNRSYITHRTVADYVNARIDKQDKVVLAATGAGYINYLLKTSNLSKFTQSSYYVYPNASDKHINDLIDEIKSAKYVILQTNDIYGDVNGVDIPTYEAVMNNAKLRAYIESNLKQEKVINSYIIMSKY